MNGHMGPLLHCYTYAGWGSTLFVVVRAPRSKQQQERTADCAGMILFILNLELLMKSILVLSMLDYLG
jgi:hypothetical protein